MEQQNQNSNYMQVQVQYRQGTVKTFLTPRDILLADFRNAMEAYGNRKVKAIRFYNDVDRAAAEVLVRDAGAIIIEARRAP